MDCNRNQEWPMKVMETYCTRANHCLPIYATKNTFKAVLTSFKMSFGDGGKIF
jgi:hypothetical protein